jgi:hypothetical protein
MKEKRKPIKVRVKVSVIVLGVASLPMSILSLARS